MLLDIMIQKMSVFLRNNCFTEQVCACFNRNVLSLIVSLFLVFSFSSCFSPEQKIVSPSEKTNEENVVEQKKEIPIQRLEEQEEDVQNTAPILIQSTITPTIEWKKPEENIKENTVVLQSPVIKDEVKPEVETTSEEAENSELEDSFNKVNVGMSYEDVIKILGEPDILVSQDSEGRMKLYRWTREGKSLYGRFENGKLTRHSQRSEPGTNNISPLTRELYEQLKIGMELDEVVALLQRPGTKVSSDDKGETLYLWTDKEGSSFSARFSNNKLVRKSGFYVRPISESDEIEEAQPYQEEPEESSITEPTQQTNEAEAPVLKDTQTQVVEQPMSQETEELVPQTTNQDQTKIVSNNRRIIYSGPRDKNVENQEAAAKQVSGRRKAKLPDYTYRLKDGSYEMKIYNPLDTPVKVGIRSGKRGRDISIPAGGSKTLKVSRGNYQIFYIREDDPSVLQEGGSIQIDGLFVGDVEVHLLK